MAKVYLEKELTAVIENAIAKLVEAKNIVKSTEVAVMKAVKTGQLPTDIQSLGAEGYQAAGILTKFAIDSLTDLNTHATDGFVFPSIAAIGSPREFNRVHVDAVAGPLGVIDAYNTQEIDITGTPPFSSFTTGDTVLLQSLSPTIGTPIDLEQVQGMIMDIDAVTTDTSTTPDRPRMRFTATYKFYEGDQLITHDESPDTGGESDSCIIRLVDR